jgi:predicted transcriptional regulator
MDNNTFQTEILSRLYQVWLDQYESDSGDLRSLAEECGVAESEFHKIIHKLKSAGYIEDDLTCWRYRLTAQGVIYAEEQRVRDDELLAKNQLIRERLLDALARHRDEYGPDSDMEVAELTLACDSDKPSLLLNQAVLAGLGHTEGERAGPFHITEKGYGVIQEHRRRKSILDEFEEINRLAPQPRGRQLQKLIAKVIRGDGWETEEGVLTLGEETDVVIYRNREYYLAQCKWEKARIQPNVIRELHGRLGVRDQACGLIMSMSGFTEGAREWAEKLTGTKYILLFGTQDIIALIHQTATFENLLNLKYNRLIKGEAIFS